MKRPSRPRPSRLSRSKLQQFWDKLGITDKSDRKEDKPAETVQPAFIETGEETDEDVTYHPEFFETPHPEPEPQPYSEPVVVWGKQSAQSVPDEQQYPWHYAGDEPEFVPPTPAKPDDIPAEVASTPVEEVHDPYKGPFNYFALALAIVLGIVVVLIMGITYLL